MRPHKSAKLGTMEVTQAILPQPVQCPIVHAKGTPAILCMACMSTFTPSQQAGIAAVVCQMRTHGGKSKKSITVELCQERQVQCAPRARGLKRTTSLADTWPIFHSSVLVMVAGHTKPPRLGPSNISATGMSPACAHTIQVSEQH